MKRIFFIAGPWPAIIAFWLVRWAGQGIGLAAMAGAAYAAFYACVAWQEQRVTRLDYGVALFFVAGLGIMLWRPAWGELIFKSYFTTALNATLLLTAILPMTWGAESFTAAFARRTTPPKYWDRPVFIRINLLLSLMWGGLFLFAALAGLHQSSWVRWTVPYTLVALGYPLNKWFPGYYAKRISVSSPHPEAPADAGATGAGTAVTTVTH